MTSSSTTIGSGDTTSTTTSDKTINNDDHRKQPILVLNEEKDNDERHCDQTSSPVKKKSHINYISVVNKQNQCMVFNTIGSDSQLSRSVNLQNITHTNELNNS